MAVKLQPLNAASPDWYFAPSGSGWDFTPIGGWGGGGGGGQYDIWGDITIPGSGGGGGQYVIGPGTTKGPGGNPSGGGTFDTWGAVIGAGVGAAAGAGMPGAAGTIVDAGTAARTGTLFPSIPWGRLAAFLLGLLLIAMGLYLIKEIRQQVNVGVKGIAEGVAA